MCVIMKIAFNKQGTSSLGVRRSYIDDISWQIFNTKWIKKRLCIKGKKSRLTCNSIIIAVIITCYVHRTKTITMIVLKNTLRVLKRGQSTLKRRRTHS